MKCRRAAEAMAWQSASEFLERVYGLIFASEMAADRARPEMNVSGRG